MIIERFFTAVDDDASVTFAMRLNTFAIAGVPDISPVELLRIKPSGNAPELIDQLYGKISPVAVRVS